MLRAVLFTDVVDSTRVAEEMGDERWGELLRRERQVIRQALKRYGGREVDTAGDGLFALFPSPAAAVRCAFDSSAKVQDLGLDIRAGVHFGEIEMSGGGAHGVVVHTGARVMSMGEPAQVLVTTTVKDLVAGARISLKELGTFELKGVPGRWALHEVTRAEATPRPRPLTADEGRVRREALELPVARRRRSAPIAVAAVVVLALGVVLLLLSRHRPVYVPGVNTVARIDPATGTFDRPIEVDSYPTGLAFGYGRLWVIDQHSQSLDRVDPSSGDVTPKGTSGTPTGIAAGAGAVWVTNAFGTSTESTSPISRINPSSLQVTSPFQAPAGSASIAAGAGALWVADQYGGRLLRFDPVTASESAISLSGRPSRVEPSFVTIGGSPPSLWVADGLGAAIYRIDPSVEEPTADRIPIGGQPTAIAVAGSTVWVTSEQGDRLFALAARSGTTLTTLDLGPRCEGPTGIGIGIRGVWVACSRSHAVVEVGGSSPRIVKVLRVDGSPDAVTVDADGGVWIAVHAE